MEQAARPIRLGLTLPAALVIGLPIGDLEACGFGLAPARAGGLDGLRIFAVEQQDQALVGGGIAGHAGMVEENEDIRIRVWPADRAIEAALAGRMTNSVTMIGLLWLASQRSALRKEWTP